MVWEAWDEPDVVIHCVVKEQVTGTSFPQLTRDNYEDWSLLVKGEAGRSWPLGRGWAQRCSSPRGSHGAWRHSVWEVINPFMSVLTTPARQSCSVCADSGSCSPSTMASMWTTSCFAFLPDKSLNIDDTINKQRAIEKLLRIVPTSTRRCRSKLRLTWWSLRSRRKSSWFAYLLVLA